MSLRVYIYFMNLPLVLIYDFFLVRLVVFYFVAF